MISDEDNITSEEVRQEGRRYLRRIK
jgi:hypothetical protein